MTDSAVWLPADEDRMCSSSPLSRRARLSSEMCGAPEGRTADDPGSGSGGSGTAWWYVGGTRVGGVGWAGGDAEREPELPGRECVPSDLRWVRAHESPHELQSVFGPWGPCSKCE